MKLLYTLFLFLSPLFLFAQQPSFNWEASSDSASWPNAVSLLSDSQGNVYTFGNHNTGSNQYMKLIRYDQNGGVSWAVEDTGFVNNISLAEAKMGEDGFIYATGVITQINNKQDAFLSKYDTLGNLIWRNFFNGPADSSDYARGLMYFNSHIYTTGSTIDNQSNYQAYIQKHDTSGTLIWSVIDSFNNIGSDQSNDIENDGTNIIITGQSDNQGLFTDLFLLAKYDPSGNKLWQTITNFNGFRSPTGMDLAVDQNKYIYVVTNGSSRHLMQFDSNGVYQWHNNATPFTFGSPASYKEVKVDAEDHIYVSGSAGIPGGIDGVPAFLFTRVDKNGNTVFNYPGVDYGTCNGFDFRGPNEIVVLGTPDQLGPQLISLDSLGNINWNIRYNVDVPFSSCTQVVVDDLKNVIIAGNVRDTTTSFPESLQTIKYGNLLFVGIPFQSANEHAFVPVEVYPNPAHNLLTIRTKSSDINSFRLFTLSGVTVSVQASTLGINQMDLTDIPSGIYFLSILRDEGQTTHKIIKL